MWVGCLDLDIGRVVLGYGLVFFLGMDRLLFGLNLGMAMVLGLRVCI